MAETLDLVMLWVILSSISCKPVQIFFKRLYKGANHLYNLQL